MFMLFFVKQCNQSIRKTCNCLFSFQILAMTSDKYLAIKYPHKASVYSTPRRTRLVILAIFLFTTLYNIPNYFLMALDGDSCHGYAVKGLFTKVFAWFSVCINCVIPFTLLVYMNYHIVQKVRQSRKQFFSKKYEIRASVVAATKSQRQASIRSLQDPGNKAKSTENQLTRMLVLVAILFLILNAPTYARFVYTTLFTAKTAKQYASFFLFLQISQKLYVTNNCINFVLYMGSGRKFRRELWEIISCKC